MSTCAAVHDMRPGQRCNFVETNPDCLSNIKLVNYLRWHYCYVDERNKFNAFWSVLAMTTFAMYIFWMLQFTIVRYFCPCLKTISDAWRLSQNTAGVTLLAMANGSPDFFISVASGLAIDHNAFLTAMSQAMFLHTFVSGIVMLTRPFQMEANYYLRDYGFLFLNVVYMDFMFKRREGIAWYLALPSTFIFIGYVVFAVIDQHLLAARIRKLEKQRGSGEEDEDQELRELKPQNEIQLTRQEIDRSKHRGGRNRGLFRQFFHSIFQFDKKRFVNGTVLIKIYLILLVPIECLLRLLIPVVDIEKPLYNWSKLLFCVQLIIVPTYICFIIIRGQKVLGITCYTIVFIIMIPFSLLCFVLTRTDTPPRGYKLASGLSFVAIVFFIFCALSEVNAMFFSVATIVAMSLQITLGTVLTWALCSNDLLTNIMLANQGFPNMAFTATFSAPVFGSFVFLALPLTLGSFLQSPTKLTLEEGHFGETVCIFLEVAMVFSFLSALTTNFQMRRACGFLMVTYYFFFLMVLFLLEFEGIRPYGY